MREGYPWTGYQGGLDRVPPDDLLDNALAIGSPHVDAEREMCAPVPFASPLCKSLTTMSLFGCLRLRCSAASMANALRSRYVRGVPSIEISNCAPGAFASGRNFARSFNDKNTKGARRPPPP